MQSVLRTLWTAQVASRRFSSVPATGPLYTQVRILKEQILIFNVSFSGCSSKRLAKENCWCEAPRERRDDSNAFDNRRDALADSDAHRA